MHDEAFCLVVAVRLSVRFHFGTPIQTSNRVSIFFFRAYCEIATETCCPAYCVFQEKYMLVPQSFKLFSAANRKDEDEQSRKDHYCRYAEHFESS